MAEADATATADLTPELDRIEAATDAGDTDLKALGFWRIVARVKADPALVDRHADQIGRIDTAAFRRGVRLRVPVWVGNALLVAGMVVGVAAVVVARTVSSATVAGLLLIAAAVVWTVAFHCPTHWIVGRIVGIRFTDYFLGGPPPPRPGLKSDYATYLRADPNGRAWMHASGAIATKLAPFLALALWPGSGAPGWSAIVLVALGVLQIGTDVAFSVKTSDWKKFRRERAVAKGRAAR
ncbi:MAG: hypothetical protein ACXVPL_10460 [Actinomycetota bacterium]